MQLNNLEISTQPINVAYLVKSGCITSHLYKILVLYSMTLIIFFSILDT